MVYRHSSAVVKANLVVATQAPCQMRLAVFCCISEALRRTCAPPLGGGEVTSVGTSRVEHLTCVVHVVEAGRRERKGRGMRSLSVAFAVVMFALVSGQALAGHFTDVPASHWAYGAIERAVTAGVLQGADGKFDGARLLNRYQMAVVVSKLLDAVAKREGAVPAAVGSDLDRLMSEFGTELALFESRLTKVEETVAALAVAKEALKPEAGPSTPLAAMEKKAQTVLSRKNKELKLGGIVKTWYKDSETMNSEFDLANARLLLLGTTGKDVKFVIQTEQAHDAVSFNSTGVATSASNNPPSIVDLKLMFNLDQNRPWSTYVQFGRFIPNFMRYQPVLIDTMDFVNYPVLTQRLAVFRQSGMEFYHKPKSNNLLFTFGVLNGSDLNDNNWTGDDSSIGGGNDAKDYFLRVDIKPKGSKLAGAIYHWDGEWGEGATKTDRTRTGAFLEYTGSPLRVLVEYIDATNSATAGDTDMDGYYAQAIYREKGSRLEFLTRYDRYDPNADVDGNDEKWFTLGANWYIEGSDCFLSLNHIDKDTAGVENKEIVAQFTLVF